MADIYQRVTDKIIEMLECGTRPWTHPWNADHTEGRIVRPLRANGVPYQGINVLLLWTETVEKAFQSPFWMTYKQAASFGGQVRKGEHGNMVVYADRFKKTDTDDKGDEVEREIPFLKAYTVFNADQVDSLPAHFNAAAAPRLNPVERIDLAEAFFKATGATVQHGGNEAYYTQKRDLIQMPVIEAFRDAEAYYSTLGHETIHWTKSPNRLDRDFGRQRFGDEGYAREELVAELGAAYLCADLDLSPEVREDHAAYIANWLAVMKGDKRAVFSAASHAQKAVDFLHSFQPKP